MKKLIEKLEKSYKQIEGRTQSVSVSLNTEQLDLIIQSLTQEPSVQSNKSVENPFPIEIEPNKIYLLYFNGAKCLELQGELLMKIIKEHTKDWDSIKI